MEDRLEFGSETPCAGYSIEIGGFPVRILEVGGIPEDTMMFCTSGPEDEHIIREFGPRALALYKMAAKEAILVRNIGRKEDE